jgi:hypothetical protein
MSEGCEHRVTGLRSYRKPGAIIRRDLGPASFQASSPILSIIKRWLEMAFNRFVG